MTTKAKTKPRKVTLTAGQAIRIQAMAAKLSAMNAELIETQRRADATMNDILHAHGINDMEKRGWMLEIAEDGDTVELVEVPDEK